MARNLEGGGGGGGGGEARLFVAALVVLPTIFPFLFSRLLDPLFLTALTSARGLEKRHRVPEAENNALPFPSD